MLSRVHQEWLEQRGIASSTARRFGLRTDDGGSSGWLTTPFVRDGEEINFKRRDIKTKRMMMDPGKGLLFWNEAALTAPGATDRKRGVVITEGELDAMIAEQCGYLAVSVPNGAPPFATEVPTEAKRYNFMYDVEDALAKVARFTLAVDGDAPGRLLANDLKEILGAERCLDVSYPDGCKDLNDVFLAHGRDGVCQLLDAAAPPPIKGLYRVMDFEDRAEVVGNDTGINSLDSLMQIVPGTLTVFTGYANMGKTTVLNTIIARQLVRGTTLAVASFETTVRPILADAVAKAVIGCSSSEYPTHAHRASAMEILQSRMLIIGNSDNDDHDMDLDGLLETCRQAVVCHGVEMVVIDPWNEIGHTRAPQETQTEYICRALRKVKLFTRRYNVAMFIVAHPSKPLKGSSAPPGLYDISDSAHWANKADYGLVFHREDREEPGATLSTVKVRMGLPGKVGSVDVYFDHRRSRTV